MSIKNFNISAISNPFIFSDIAYRVYVDSSYLKTTLKPEVVNLSKVIYFETWFDQYLDKEIIRFHFETDKVVVWFYDSKEQRDLEYNEILSILSKQ